jgi:hypothetical protein
MKRNRWLFKCSASLSNREEPFLRFVIVIFIFIVVVYLPTAASAPRRSAAIINNLSFDDSFIFVAVISFSFAPSIGTLPFVSFSCASLKPFALSFNFADAMLALGPDVLG